MCIGPQPLRNSFGVIQSVDRKQHFSPVVTPLPVGVVLCGLRIALQKARIFLGRNPDRECLEAHRTTSQRDLGDPALHAEHAQQRGTELLQMRMRLKGKQIGSEEPFQQLFAPRQDGEDLRGWEWYVQKETDGSVRKSLAQHLRQEYQVVIVNPDQVLRSVTLDYRLTEDSVRFDIGVPVPRVEFQLRGEIV